MNSIYPQIKKKEDKIISPKIGQTAIGLEFNEETQKEEHVSMIYTQEGWVKK